MFSWSLVRETTTCRGPPKLDRAKQPGIRFVSVTVDSIRFQDIASTTDKVKDLEFQISVPKSLPEVATSLVTTMAFRVIPRGEVSSRFRLEVRVSGHFESDESPNLDLATFARHQAPSLVLPFVRELIANISARSRQGLVLVPPINVLALFPEREEASTPE